MASTSWTELSDALAAAARGLAAAVVRVDGARRAPGSGVVWSADGVIVTTSHGLDDEGVELGLPSGDTVPARVVGHDPATDVAVLAAEATGLAPAAWSDAAPQVGQLALAVSRPGRSPRVSLGVVGRVGDAWRTAAGGRLDRWVELEVGVQHGFSGGLAADLGGRGLGLATAGLVRGAPLAIPPATLRRVVTALLEHGAVPRGYLGVVSLPVRLPASLAERAGQASALLLSAVEDDSPAARAGLTLGDLLLALDGAAVGHMGDLLPLLEEERIGQVARARICRGGAIQEVPVTVGVRGGRPGSGP